jgi:hypothetical protein
MGSWKNFTTGCGCLLLLWFSGCGDGDATTTIPDSESQAPVDAGADSDSLTGTGDTGSETETFGTGTETEFSDTGTDSETSSWTPLEWTFDADWDGFVHAYGDIEFTRNADDGTLELDAEFPGPEEESTFAKELFAADWRGATAVDIVVKTLEHTTGYWRLELDTGYAWSPCITTIDHPETPEWTTITFDFVDLCGDALMLDLTQALWVGVKTGDDAAGPERVRVAVDSITVR